MMTEEMLSRLFDYQKFEGNGALAAAVDAVHSRYGVREMAAEEMDFVSAAGTADLRRNGADPDNGKK